VTPAKGETTNEFTIESPNEAPHTFKSGRALSTRKLLPGLIVLSVACTFVATMLAQSGNINPLAIEIDKNANLYPGDGNANILNPGATADWVKDSLANTDTPSLVDNVGGMLSLTPDCDADFGYSATGTGGSGTYLFSFKVFKSPDLVNPVKTFATSVQATSTSGTIDTSTMGGEGAYSVTVTVTDSNGCFFTTSAGPVDIRNQLTASASKTAATRAIDNGDGFSATVTGVTNELAGDSITFQWQRLNGANRENINIAGLVTTNKTLTLSLGNVQTLGVKDTLTGPIGTDSFDFNRWSTSVKLHTVRTLNGQTCTADSSGVFVKAVKGIDP
jgi:hypothetical protein